jgi:hypothetical protein
VALIALCGGIPVDLLDTEPDFEYKSEHFQTIGIPIEDSSLGAGTEATVDSIVNLFKALEKEMKKPFDMSEGSLRMLFWDPVFVKSFFDDTDEDSEKWGIRSEVLLENLLNLDCERRADLAVFDTKFKTPILICEASEEGFPDNKSHKDFAKISSILTISCIRLAEKLANEGINPLLARTFGVLVGGPCFQLAVAHPVLTAAESGLNEIRVDVSTHKHWFFDLSSTEGTSFPCQGPCCTKSDLEPILHLNCVDIPIHTVSEESLKQFIIADLDDVDEGEYETKTKPSPFTQSNLESNINFMEVDLEGEIDYISVIENFSNINDDIDINRSAIIKFSIFIKIVKNYMKKLHELKKDPSKPVPKFKRPNLAYVPVAIRRATKETPADKQLRSVNSRTEEGLFSTPTNNFSGRRKSLNEFELYKKKLNAFFCFPRVLGSLDLSPSNVHIMYEKMVPLIGDGFYGPYGQLFGPQIRTESPIQLILDACTFAVHSLYGLHVLHEMVGYVHGNLSPENIMFSPSDDIWKLNDFEFALPVETSLETVRECEIQDFVAPESFKTGIFTKSSDVYALGQVLWRIFNVQIMWLTCFTEQDEPTEKAYENFCEAVTLMIQDLPAQRPSVISSMKLFNEIIKNNQSRDFHIYGSGKLMIVADQLTEDDIEEDVEDEKGIFEMIFTKITTNPI